MLRAAPLAMINTHVNRLNNQQNKMSGSTFKLCFKVKCSRNFHSPNLEKERCDKKKDTVNYCKPQQ